MHVFRAGLAFLMMCSAAWAGVEIGSKPKITWLTTNGARLTEKSLQGQITIVDFWATWCGPCMREAPHMVALSKQYGPQGVKIIGVSLDNDARAMLSVAQNKGFDWPQILDKSGIADQWGVDGIPHTFILSPAGEVLWKGHPARIDKPLAEIVQKHPTRMGQLTQATQMLDEAAGALLEKNYEVVFARLASIPPAARGEGKLAPKLKAIAKALESNQEDQAILAPLLEKNPAVAAMLKQALTAPADDSMGASAAAPGADSAPAHTQARESLAMAKNLASAGLKDQARAACEKLLAEHPNAPQAEEARKLLAELR